MKTTASTSPAHQNFVDAAALPSYAQQYICYTPTQFRSLVDVLTTRHRARQAGQYAEADALKSLLCTSEWEVRDAPWGSLFAPPDLTGVPAWAFFFDAAKTYGMDVTEVAGTERDWARAIRGRRVRQRTKNWKKGE